MLTWLILAGLVTNLINNVMVCYNGNRQIPTYNMYTHKVIHTCIACPHVAMHFVVLLKCAPDTYHIELVVNLYRTRHAAGTTCTKHGLQTAKTLRDMLLARPTWSMISRQQQHYKTCCWHDPHKAWSPYSNNITRYAAGMTHVKHDLQTATTLQDMLLAQPARSMISRQQQHYKTYCWHDLHEAWSPDSNNITRCAVGTTHTKHGFQTATTLQDMLLAQPARSMNSRQQQHYKAYCWHDLHEAWSPDSNNITRHAAGTNRTKHDLQTATKLQDILLAKPDPHKAWSLANKIIRHIVGKPSRVTYSW